MMASGFFTAPTITTLTGGAAGALIAVVGAFLVARFTVRVERQRDERTAVREVARQDFLDRQAVAAALARVLAALESETRAAPFLAGRTQRAMLDAVIEAHRITFRAHPAVAAWLLAQHAELTTLSNWSYRIVLWTGFSGQYKRYAERLGMLLGDVQAWVIGQRDDQWFADELTGHAAGAAPEKDVRQPDGQANSGSPTTWLDQTGVTRSRSERAPSSGQVALWRRPTRRQQETVS